MYPAPKARPLLNTPLARGMWFFFGTTGTLRLCVTRAKQAGLGGEEEGKIQL